MKTPTSECVARRGSNPIHHLIQRATGAAGPDLPRIENIMREDIFHSTLDWQTRAQLEQAAREAHQLLNDNRELYDLDHACRAAMFHKMRAEADLREADTAAHRAGVAAAERTFQTARATLFGKLDARGPA